MTPHILPEIIADLRNIIAKCNTDLPSEIELSASGVLNEILDNAIAYGKIVYRAALRDCYAYEIFYVRNLATGELTYITHNCNEGSITFRDTRFAPGEEACFAVWKDANGHDCCTLLAPDKQNAEDDARALGITKWETIGFSGN